MSRPRRRNITHIHNTYPQASSVKTSALWIAYVCMVIWMSMFFLQQAEIRNLGELVRVQNEMILLSQVRADRYRDVADDAVRRLANDTPETDSGMIQQNFLVSPNLDQMAGQNGATYIDSSAWSPNCTGLRVQYETLVRSYQDGDGMNCEVYRNDQGHERTTCINNDQNLMVGVVGDSNCNPVVETGNAVMSHWWIYCSDESENERIASVADHKQP